MRVRMRASRAVILCLTSALAACGNRASVTPPIYAPLPASDADPEAAPASGRLPADTHPLAYRLRFELDPKQAGYRGSTAIELTLDRPRETLWLHARGPRLWSHRLSRGRSSVSSMATLPR